MTLISCPDCGRDVSSHAIACPHCGYPLTPEPAPETSPVSPWPEPTLPPSPPLYQQPEPVPLRYLSFGLTGTVMGFLWGCVALFALAAVAYLAFWGVWLAWSGGSSTLQELVSAEDFALGALGFAFLALLVTAVLFVIWSFQAYMAAQSRGATRRQWASGWTIGAWFIPFANLVIPKLVMNEVDRMSNPAAGQPPIDDRWRPLGRMAISDFWWAAWITGVVVYSFGSTLEGAVEVADDTFATSLLLQAIGFVFYAIAAGLATGVVLTIGKRLRRPRY